MPRKKEGTRTRHISGAIKEASNQRRLQRTEKVCQEPFSPSFPQTKEEARKMEEKLQCKKTLQIQNGILESNHPHRKAMLS